MCACMLLVPPSFMMYDVKTLNSITPNSSFSLYLGLLLFSSLFSAGTDQMVAAATPANSTKTVGPYSSW